MAQAFITTVRLRQFDNLLGKVTTEQKGTSAAEQAVMVHSLLQNREYLEGVVRIVMQSPERVVEGLVSLVGDNMLTE